jgi:AcrR family transcriptional regulator
MGPETATTRAALMDATEAVMREEGYAAVTSRRVAERAGVNQQTVYYYFQNMDDLLLATYRRRTEQVLERTEQALASDRPLHALWQGSSDPSDAALTVEYLALANHNEAIRLETIEFGDRLRRLKAETLAQRLAANSPDPDAATPMGMIVALGFVAHLLGCEAALGIRSGHKDTRMLAEWCLRQLEPNGGRSRALRDLEREPVGEAS